MKSHYYTQHAGALRAELGAAISREERRALHRKQPVRHLLVAARQFAILGLTTWALIRVTNAGLRLEEVPVTMEARASGESKLRGSKAVKLVLTVVGTLVAAKLIRSRR